MSAVLAAARRSAPVTDWGPRLAWTAVVLVGIVLVALLMRRGWRRRAGRQSDLPTPSAAPADPGPVLARAEGVYVSTTTEGDWLDRVVVHHLGERSSATLTVHAAGIAVDKARGSYWIDRTDLRGVRRAPGMAGKFVGEDGLLVLTWRLGDRSLDTGFRTEESAAQRRVEDAVNSLLLKEVS